MKKLIFISIAILCYANVFSQIEKGKFNISFEGNYRNTVPDDKPESSSWLTGNLSLAPSISYYLSDKMYVGLGMEMTWLNETSSEQFYFNPYLFYSATEAKTRNYLPYLFVGANFKLFDRCYAGGRVEAMYGIFKIETLTVNITAQPFNTSLELTNINEETKFTSGRKKSTGNIFAIQAVPEISYFLSNHFCTYFTLGSLGFAKTRWDNNVSDNYSNWIFDFTPSLWNLGFRIML